MVLLEYDRFILGLLEKDLTNCKYIYLEPNKSIYIYHNLI